MIPLVTVYYSEYLINQGVVSAIAFDNSPFSKKDKEQNLTAHYVYYQAVYAALFCMDA